jgi:hypothetical protein
MCSPYSVLATLAAPDYTDTAAGGVGQDALAGTPGTMAASMHTIQGGLCIRCAYEHK